MDSNNLFTTDHKIADIISISYRQVLLLEHLNLPLIVKEKTVGEFCLEHNINSNLYLCFARLFAMQDISDIPILGKNDINNIINYLKNSHNYYQTELIAKINQYVKQIAQITSNKGVLLLEQFVDDYVKEISEHFQYENDIVFKYITNLASDSLENIDFNVEEYKKHHDNIDETLADIKGLLVKYLPFEDNDKLRRRLLKSLFALENDLKVHTLIEDKILIPLVEKLENPNAESSTGKAQERPNSQQQNSISNREIDVLKLLIDGFSNKEVSDKLFISTHTVISHRKNISEKTGIKSLAGLTIYAIQNGIITID